MKAHGLPDRTFTFWVTAISLLYSSDGQLIPSAFTRRISTLVDNTSYLHFSGIICFPDNKQKPKSDYRYSCIFIGQATYPRDYYTFSFLSYLYESNLTIPLPKPIWFTLCKRKIKTKEEKHYFPYSFPFLVKQAHSEFKEKRTNAFH